MEITQFTYFQQVGGLDCNPITGEITYGLERLAMYLQDVENVFDLVWTLAGGRQLRTLTYRDVFFQNEVEQSTLHFEQSNVAKLFEQFALFESEAKRLLEAKLPLPGYEMILKAAHTFNLLDARGAISVTERAAYIGRIRTLSRLVAQAYVESREALGFPMLPDARRDEPSGAVAGSRGMSTATLVVELLTEELPPKALKSLGEAFATRSAGGLARARVPLADSAATALRDAAPAGRRDHARVRAVAPDKPFKESLMPVSVAFDAQGNVRRRRCAEAQGEAAGGTSTPRCAAARNHDGKAEYSVTPASPRATRSSARLQAALDETLAKLPIPQVMSYARPGSYYNDGISSARRTACSRCTATAVVAGERAWPGRRPHHRRPSLPQPRRHRHRATPTPTKQRWTPKARSSRASPSAARESSPPSTPLPAARRSSCPMRCSTK